MRHSIDSAQYKELETPCECYTEPPGSIIIIIFISYFEIVHSLDLNNDYILTYIKIGPEITDSK